MAELDALQVELASFGSDLPRFVFWPACPALLKVVGSHSDWTSPRHRAAPLLQVPALSTSGGIVLLIPSTIKRIGLTF